MPKGNLDGPAPRLAAWAYTVISRGVLFFFKALHYIYIYRTSTQGLDSPRSRGHPQHSATHEAGGDGLLQQEEVVDCLTPGTEANMKFHAALGLAGGDAVLAVPSCWGGCGGPK